MQALETVRQQARHTEAEYAVRACTQVDAYVRDIKTLLGEFDSCRGILPPLMQWVIWVLAQVTGIFCASSHVLVLKHAAGFLHKHPVDQPSSQLLLLSVVDVFLSCLLILTSQSKTSMMGIFYLLKPVACDNCHPNIDCKGCDCG